MAVTSLCTLLDPVGRIRSGTFGFSFTKTIAVILTLYSSSCFIFIIKLLTYVKKLYWKHQIWHYSFVSLLFSHWRPLLIHFQSIITSLSLNCAFVIFVLLLFLIRLLVCYFGTESWKSPLALKSCKICNPRAHLSQDPVPTKICCHGNNTRPAPVHQRGPRPRPFYSTALFEDPKNNVTHVNALSMAQCWALQCYLLSIHPVMCTDLRRCRAKRRYEGTTVDRGIV